MLSLCFGHRDSNMYRHPEKRNSSKDHIYATDIIIAMMELTGLIEELQSNKIKVENVLKKENQNILQLYIVNKQLTNCFELGK